MTPITDTERTAGQFRALAVLGALLERQVARRLPPIAWTVTSTGTLHGDCAGSQAAFTAWRDELGQPDQDRMIRQDGASRLTATWDSRGRVQVILTATIADEPVGGEGNQS